MEAVATEEKTAYEIERGKPMPSYNHGRVELRLGAQFLKFEDRFDVATELTIELDGTPYTPDISVCEKRTSDWSHDVVRLKEAPLCVVEILSPTQGFNSITPKIDAYFAGGIQSVWVVHPEIQTVTIFTGPSEKTVYPGGVVTDPKLEISADLDRVFA